MEHGLKAIFITVGSFLSAVLGILYIPVLLMVFCNIIDYITGLMAAANRADGISSYKSIRGITKKVTMWLLVVVGAIIDNLVKYCTDMLGLDLGITFLVAAVVAVWIICNELLSILENMIDIGIRIPGFLNPLVTWIKGSAESKVNVPEDKKENEP